MAFYQLATIIIFLTNSYFVLQWCYLFLLSIDWKNAHYQRFLRIYAYIMGRKYSSKDCGDGSNIQVSNLTEKSPNKSHKKGKLL